MTILPDFSRWTLRKKLVSIIMLGSGVCLFVGMAVLVASSAASRYEESLRQISGLGDVLAENGQAALTFADRREADRLLESLSAHHEIAAAWLVSDDGIALASWSRNGGALALPADYRTPSTLLRSDFWSRRAELFRPVFKNAEQVGYVLLQADFSEQWNRELASLGKALSGAVLALLVVFLLATRLQRVISRPIGEIADTARAITRDKSYALRVPQRTDDEIGELVQAFNHMLQEIQERDESLTGHRDRLEKEVAKRTAELVHARDEAEAASRFKGIFLANMSHEIRTPMNAITGLSDLALAGELTPRLRDYLGKIHSSSLALLSITNDILDYSKVEAGRLDLTAEAFHLEDLLQNVLDLFVTRAGEKNLEVVIELDAGIPRVLVGDALRLGQVLNNLVSNAIKFTMAGEVHIGVRLARQEDGQVSLEFSVRDTGIGMTAEQRATLFQAFTQADGSITRRFGGTGLGLALSQRLVRLMGGEIALHSEAGAGSTFSFTLRLPLAQAEQHGLADAGLEPMRVLVVDDLALSARILHGMLEGWGFSVSVAASGSEALARLKQAQAAGNPFELALIDWDMPGLDGVQTARMLREMIRMQEIRPAPVVIMVSAFSKERMLDEARDVSLDAILVKPVTPAALRATLTRLQGGETRAPAGASHPRLQELSAAVRGAHVLLVEDNDINRLVARELLEQAGLQVTEAQHGQEAVEAVLNSNFDAVLMDLQMPVMSGLEATRRIRLNPASNDLPIIAMTAAVLEQDREACRAAGMNDHVAKPILPQALLGALTRWIKPGQRSVVARAAAAPEHEASGFPASLPGLELQHALGLLNGNRALLRKLLLRFAERFATAATEMRALVDAGEPGAAAALAHKIKGASGNLGALELYRAVKRLEGELLTGATPSGLADFERAALLTMSSIAQLDATGSAGGPAAAGPGQRRPATTLLAQLRTLLEGDDFVPQELMEELKATLSNSSLHRHLQQIEKHLDEFNYAHARAVLAQLDSALGSDQTGVFT